MKTLFKSIILIFTFSFGYGQDIERVEINGRINVDIEDKEGITVYNQSSNKGTITDENGTFKILVAENDIIAFGALQFKDFTIRIDDRIIKSRQVSVRLVEEVNKLDEVIVLPYDLSGNLNVDVEAVRTYNVDMAEVYKGEEDFDDYKFSADNKTKIDDPLLDENRFRNGINFVNLFGLLVKKKNKPKTEIEKLEAKQSPIAKRYTPKFLETTFNIPLDLTESFLVYLEDRGYDKLLLELKNEMYLIEFLEKESQLFLLRQK
ncbi:carboxypeptidase-like protein [Winogradskyella wandonensis]|uniref:Carboxypeptidase-like protein n=1 Tax=Winogradskyella wandonensis TaxID=1442586 RepID=A0A4R1KRX0_9FLAO|nr:carboxypeptidase-like regulatory domain-containing protein [Winogradskyella wandonensis]TCK67330.1 carboxypeptidase-like protein [Winogradskyella wandonensis]